VNGALYLRTESTLQKLSTALGRCPNILMAVCLRKTAENSMKFSNCNLKVDNLKIHGLMEFW
jgi:hypothetical protein